MTRTSVTHTWPCWLGHDVELGSTCRLLTWDFDDSDSETSTWCDLNHFDPRDQIRTAEHGHELVELELGDVNVTSASCHLRDSDLTSVTRKWNLWFFLHHNTVLSSLQNPSGFVFHKYGNQLETKTSLFPRCATRCRSAGSSLVRLEGRVDGPGVQTRVGKEGAALPSGLSQDSVKEAGGTVRSSCWPTWASGHSRGPVEPRRSPDAGLYQQLWSTATTGGGGLNTESHVPKSSLKPGTFDKSVF